VGYLLEYNNLEDRVRGGRISLQWMLDKYVVRMEGWMELAQDLVQWRDLVLSSVEPSGSTTRRLIN
jgi:hypothetical protein